MSNNGELDVPITKVPFILLSGLGIVMKKDKKRHYANAPDHYLLLVCQPDSNSHQIVVLVEYYYQIFMMFYQDIQCDRETSSFQCTDT